MKRYERQMKLSQIGEKGQEKLKHAVVAVIGAGGLGSPVLTYLVMAGVGTIRVVDDDHVNLTNLNRQYLHGEADLGKEKVQSAKEALKAMNSDVMIETYSERLTEENAAAFVSGADVVIDCVDNIATRLVVNRICMERKIPLVEGGISGFYGFVTVVGREYACLRCLGYGEEKEKEEIPALGAVAGVIGSLQAVECLKILLDCGNVLYGRMLQYDGIESSFDEIPIQKRVDCELHQMIDRED